MTKNEVIDRRFFEEDKERVQKMDRNSTKDHLKKKKIKKSKEKVDTQL